MTFGDAAIGGYMSLPARGAWIEIRPDDNTSSSPTSLPARGVWIEMLFAWSDIPRCASHSPQGECGLKFSTVQVAESFRVSLPARGVWIEIKTACFQRSGSSSHSPQGECGLKFSRGTPTSSIPGHSPQGECGLKFETGQAIGMTFVSLPARGVWIEIVIAR